MSILNTIKSVASLGQNINKVSEERKDKDEGAVSEFLEEFKIDMSDDDLIALAKKWEVSWKEVYEGSDDNNDGLEERQKQSVKYWRGNAGSGIEAELGIKVEGSGDNLIFEALETFLPIATKQNPEPMVNADNTPEGVKLADTIKKVLVHQSGMTRLNLKITIKQAVRNWALKFVGAVQIGWSGREDDMDIEVVKPEHLILDPNGYIKRGEYIGEFIGRLKKDTAKNLIARFPDKKKDIEEQCNSKLGTKMNYKEFWTDDYVFWKLNDVILAKIKNPHWNYEEEVKEPVMTVDEDGNEIQDFTEDGDEIYTTTTIPGANHFKYPKKPFVLLSIFNLGDKPYDETSLIEQNIPNQDKINKRSKQIDKNIDNINSGWVISGDAGFNEAQSTRAAEALMGGGVAFCPKGDPNKLVTKITGDGLPADVYNERQDARNELRGVFGITGLQPQGTQNEKTVRGKILQKTADVDRIGGGISEYIELFSSKIYDWLIQMMYVYYDEEHSFPILGKDGTQDWITIKNSDIDKSLTVSVKEGSLIPKDSLTKSHLAIDLWGAGALDPLSLYEYLEFPNPKEMVQKLIQWNENPMALIGEGEAPPAQMPVGSQTPAGQPAGMPTGGVPINI